MTDGPKYFTDEEENDDCEHFEGWNLFESRPDRGVLLTEKQTPVKEHSWFLWLMSAAFILELAFLIFTFIQCYRMSKYFQKELRVLWAKEQEKKKVRKNKLLAKKSERRSL